MNSARLLLLLIGIAFLWFIIRQVMKHWLGGPDRNKLYREMDSAERMIEREAGNNIPRCPVCNSLTQLYKYPHIRVWRCCNYPECRGFVKAKKPTRMKFASDWDRKRTRK